MNDIKLHGRLTRDPELTQGAEPNKDRCNFTIAVDRKFGDETDFFPCVVWGKRAAVIKKYFAKGKEIIVSGEAQIRSYEGKDGVKRKDISVVVSDFDFCGSAKSEPKPEQTSDDSWTEQEEDIPF